jgi:Mn2+/Fe2+ NRAMP family transporter
VKQIGNIALGVVTSIAGFIDVGTIATAALAGAVYGFQLLWVIALATLCAIFLTEMAGRLAAVSHHTIADALRERLGFHYFTFPLIVEILCDVVLLAAEIGGTAVALHLVTGIDFRWFVPLVAFVSWLLLWFGTFGLIQNGISLLGLLTLVFVIAAWKLGFSWAELGRGLIPSTPASDPAQYWFFAVSIIGSIYQPYIFNFYASGAVEDKWTLKDVAANRVVATLGMAFGGFVAMGVLVTAALALGPHGIHVDSYEQAALMLTQTFGRWGIPLFAGALGIAAFSTVLPVALNLAYLVAQGMGWNWSENLKPHEDARFALVYTLAIPVSMLITLFVEPLNLTLVSMALNAVIASIVLAPLLMLMNDRAYLREYRNGVIANVIGVVIILLAVVIGIAAIPLEVLGG